MMVEPTTINGFEIVAALPYNGNWRLASAMGGQCVVAYDVGGVQMPKLIIGTKVHDLLGTDQQHYLEFLIDPDSTGRRH